MLSFKQFITEGIISFDTKDISDAAKAAGRAELVSLAKISAADFQKMQQYFTNASSSNIVKTFNDFVGMFPTAAKAINGMRGDGVGPGEMVLYFVFNNIGIGGKNASIDAYLDGKEFAEVKGGRKRGASEINNFRLNTDGDTASTKLISDLNYFNDKYEDITGEELPDWAGAAKVNTEPLRKWRKIDLKALAADTKTGSKKNIDLLLKKDGDLFRKGDGDPLLNVIKDKTLAPIKKLISSDGDIAVDVETSTIEKIEQRWKDQTFKDYVSGKKFILIDSNTLTIKHFGELKLDMVGLDYTNRGQVYAVVNLDGEKKSQTEPKKKATKA